MHFSVFFVDAHKRVDSLILIEEMGTLVGWYVTIDTARFGYLMRYH